MEMLSQRQVTFFLLVCFSAILVNDAASTSTSCPEVACLGQPVNITCDMTGEYKSVGFSRPDTIEVITCLASEDECYVNDDNYDIVFRSPEKHIILIKKFAKKDIGEWNCRDGTDPLLKTCHVDGYDVKQSPTPPTPDCVRVDKTTFGPSTLCKGFEEDPNVNITITVANLPYTFTYDQYKQNDDVSLPYIPKGGDVECRVTGPASQCYTVSKPYKNEICAPGLPIRVSIVIGLVVVLGLVGLAVDCFYCKTRDKGLTHFVMAKLKSRNADVTTEDTSKKEEKTEEKTDRTDSPEKKPLLNEKTTYANSHVTVENETDMKKELEPEDKEDATKPQDKGPAILEVKPQDEGAASTGVKPQDKGAITWVKPQDEGTAILDVKSENKEAAQLLGQDK
ncbi:uncharacterized protein [Haliotis cracherodii]|uniref:uncharacterized protein n=1 Tax=Haliotis cracherodii TaxID=6455 RepID=UPI0039EC29AC